MSMRRICFAMALVFGIIPFQQAYAGPTDDFCSIDKTLSQSGYSKAITLVSATLLISELYLQKLLKADQASKLLNAKTQKALSEAKRVLKAMKGSPIRNVLSVLLPIAEANMLALKKISAPSRTQKLHKLILQFDQFVWKPFTLAFLALKGVSFKVCGLTQSMGQCFGKKCPQPNETIAEKRLRLQQNIISKWNATLRTIQNSTDTFSNTIVKSSTSLVSLQNKLKDLQRKLQSIQSKLDKTKAAMGPFIASMNELGKVMNKRICVVYGVKVKVKVKAKFWKSKFKVKKLKFCFTVGKIMGGVSGVIKPVAKLLDKAAKKILNPITKKLTRALPRLNLPEFGPFHKAVDEAAAPFQKLDGALKSQKPQTITSYTQQMNDLHKELQAVPK